MSDTPDARDDDRLPPPPPALSTGGEQQPQEDPGDEPTPVDWLDPTSSTHHRRRRPEPKGPIQKARRRWRRWRRHRRRLARRLPWYRPRNIVAGIVGLILVGLISVLLSAYILISDIRRAPLLPVSAATSSVGTNILLFGSNGESGALELDPGSLVVQFIHIGANFGSGQVIDLPRDLLLGTGSSAPTIEERYRRSGVVGVVSAVQQTMGLTVNHVVQTTFAGYAQVTDDLGGLSIQTDSGIQTFSGAQAEAYAGQPSPAGGTIETGHRYQHWSKAMLQAALQPGVLLDPLTLWSVFKHTVSNVVVDDTLDNGALISLVWHLRALHVSQLHFFTVPNDGYSTAQGRRVLLPNATAFARLSTAIRTDNLATIGLFQ